MKKMISLAAVMMLAGCLWVGTAAAQADSSMHHKMGKMKDCIMMKDGKVMVMKGGQTMELMSDTTLSGGAQVKTTGEVVMKDGTTATLKEGDMVGSSGKIMPMMDRHKKKMKPE